MPSPDADLRGLEARAQEMEMKISAHIVVPEASKAAAWYANVFGAAETSRIPLPGGKVMAVVVQVGESELHIGSEFPQMGIVSPLTLGGTATVLQINTDDVDALWKRALEAGAQVRHPIAETFWGERHGQITDPFGHRWNLAQHVRDVSPAEVAAAAAKVFGGP